MGYWFFFSYARKDNNNAYVKKFFKELEAEVRDLVGGEDVGFFDTEDISHGAQWRDVLYAALQNSRIFISLFSSTYFSREICGKEWTVFRSRLELYQKYTGEMPPLLLPVLWIPADFLPPTLPAPLTSFQFGEGDYPDKYLEVGVGQLIKNRKYKTKYQDLVFELAKTIVRNGRKYEKDGVSTLPKLPELPPLEELPSAFPHADGAGEGKNNPRHVQLIYVAEKTSRMTGLREKLDAYGPIGGGDWQPFLPSDKSIHSLVNSAIEGEGFLSNPAQLKSDLVEEIKKAEGKNKIVVVILDVWTLQIEEYKQMMRDYDDNDSVNCVVLIPWNSDDDELRRHSDRLDNIVREVFCKHRPDQSGRQAVFYPLKSAEQLETRLREAIRNWRERVLNQLPVEGISATLKPMERPFVKNSGGKVIT